MTPPGGPAGGLPPHDWHAPIIAAIVAAYGRHRPAVYVEIGVDRGHTMRAVAPHAEVAHAVDVTFANLSAPLPENVVRHEMQSEEFWRRRKGGLADVVFIDGDHSERAVLRDIANALLCLKVGGTIIAHDTFPVEQRWARSHCGDGYRVIDALHADRLVDCATLQIFPGLTFINWRRQLELGEMEGASA